MNVESPIEPVKSVRRLPPWLLVAPGTFALAIIVGVMLMRSPADHAFGWFSRLGFPEVAGRSYVKVATGGWSQSDKGPEGEFIHGFLLGQSNDTFTVLTTDLFARTYKATASGTPAHKKIGFEPLDLQKEANTQLQLLRNSAQNPRARARFGRRLDQRAEIFFLAWACDRNGHADLAQQLFDQARAECEKVPAATNWWGRITSEIDRVLKRPSKQFGMIEQLERDIGHAMMWRAVVEFGETNLSRRELHKKFCAIVDDYPRSPHRKRAKETAERLAGMIVEDDAHRTIGDTELERLPNEKRVAELIFRLRDQNGHQWGQPGWCEIFEDWRGVTNTPAHRLVGIGYAAVPQLIAALDDPAFTRSVGYHRDFYFSHTVLTVGDCAAAVLHRITGKSFYTPEMTSGHMSRDAKISATRKAAENWLAEFQRKGEKQVLMEATERGDNDSPAQARLLLERYPTTALTALVRGVSKADQDWTRNQLVETVSRVPGDAPVAFLREEMVKSPFLRCRVTAARELYERGHTEAISAMIAEWRNLGSPIMPNRNWDVEALIRFLASCGRPDAVEALGEGLKSKPVRLRVSVIFAFDEGRNPGHNTAPEESAAATERLLIAHLEDTERRVGLSGSDRDKSFLDPRVCDVAGHVLWKRWPAKYSFDLGATEEQREQQRLACIDASRNRSH